MFKAWLSAIRPRTLVASILPVCLGASSFEFSLVEFPWTCFGLCMAFAMLVQVGTNLANDYYDGVRGTDCDRSNAPSRMVAGGVLSSKAVITAATIILLSAFCVGCFAWRMSEVSPWFLPFGVLCAFLAYAYTGGPFPLAYNGLGDLFVILFFGFGAVEGTRMILSSAINMPWEPCWLNSLGMGLMINNLLIVNNYRDYEGDRKAGKRTSVVIFGKKFGLVFYLFSFLGPIILFPFFSLAPFPLYFASIAGFLGFYKLLNACSKSEYSGALKVTALSIVIYGVLQCIFN